MAGFVRGVTFKPSDVVEVGDEDSVACMRTKNVQTELDLDDVLGIPTRFVKRDEQYLRPGDLLVSSANSWNLVGKCAWVGELPWRSTFGGFVTIVRPDASQVEPRYLYRWFSHPHTQAVLRSFGRKTTSISNLDLGQTKSMPIPLPPIEEQQRIVAALDQADELRAKRRSALALLDTLTESIFFEMFGSGRQTPVDLGDRLDDHADGWRWERLSDVAELATGHTPDRSRPDYWNGGISWVNLNEIRSLDGRVASSTRLQVSEEGIRHSSAVVLPTGTVCLSRTASIGFVTVMGVPMSSSQDFVNWICGDRLDPTYLMHALLRSRERLRSISSGSTHRTIYMRVAEQLRVLVPPIDLQHEFSNRIKRLGQVVTQMDGSLEHLNMLFSSLEQRAFRGDL